MNKRKQEKARRWTETNKKIKSIWDTITPARMTPGERERLKRRMFRFALPDKNWKEVCEQHYASANSLTWQQLVHEIATVCQPYRKDNKQDFLKAAQLELRMVHEIMKRSYLDGRLRDTPKAKPTLDAKRKARLKQIDRLVKQWATKEKRATNAMKKLKRERTAIVRRMATP